MSFLERYLKNVFMLLISFRIIKPQAMMAFLLNFIANSSETFVRCANECFQRGAMPRKNQAVITLIEKKGKDCSFVENWRPISFVKVDAKIISKVIALRIKNFLPYIIHHNQTCYVKDRFIGETVRSIFDIIWISQSTKKSLVYCYSSIFKRHLIV